MYLISYTVYCPVHLHCHFLILPTTNAVCPRNNTTPKKQLSTPSCAPSAVKLQLSIPTSFACVSLLSQGSTEDLIVQLNSENTTLVKSGNCWVLA